MKVSWIYTCLLAATLPSTISAECSLCEDSEATIANPDKIIPVLGFGANNNPTCLQAQQIAEFAGDDACQTIQAHANFCGCPEATGPVNQCSLCPGGQQDDPADLDYVTPFGDTCGELQEYVSYLSEDECNTDRVSKLILTSDWLCQCPNAQTECAMCADGTRELPDDDLVIPYTGGSTCGFTRDYASTGVADCDMAQGRAAFCGCPNTEPLNLCTFCSDGNDPAHMDLKLPQGESCSDYNSYFSYLDQSQCDGDLGRNMQALGFLCGCAGVDEPVCELCEGGVPDPDAASGNPSATCGEQQALVRSLGEDLCSDQANTIASIQESCGCPSAAHKNALVGKLAVLSAACLIVANMF